MVVVVVVIECADSCCVHLWHESVQYESLSLSSLLTAGIQIIGNNFIRGPTIQGLVQADDEFQKVHGLRRSQSVGLLYDSRSGSLVTNGRPGQLQFFCVDSGCQLLNVCTSLLHVIYTHTPV